MNIINLIMEFIIDQTNWDELIYENDYDSNKEIIKYEYNDFSVNGIFEVNNDEFKLNKNNDLYDLYVRNLNIDIIDKISLKIKLKNSIDKLLLFGFYIRLTTFSGSDNINLLNTNLLDSSLLSYLNDYSIEEDDNIITIPLIQFNILEHGYLYRKLSKKTIHVEFENVLKSYNIDHNIINEVSIVFNGRKYYNFKSFFESSIGTTKKIFYPPTDINWFFTTNSSSNVSIKWIYTQCKFIVLKLINHSDNEFSYNQPIIEEITFDSKVYDLQYMKQIILFGINIYILPLFPEFTNLENIIYQLKNSNNSIDMFDTDTKMNIKTNTNLDSYHIYLSFVGDWSS